MTMLAPTLGAASLLALQRAGASHIGISLTKACPMTCAHCAASALPASRWRAETLPPATIAAYCEEFPALHAAGVRRLSLTGGEPVLVLPLVERLANAAAAAGLEVTLVTGLFWARTESGRRRVLDRLEAITHWNISWDLFHRAEVSLEQCVAAATLLCSRGKAVSIRYTTANPVSDEDFEAILALAAQVPDGCRIAFQEARPVGRAQEAAMPAAPQAEPPRWPCLSTGPIVLPDGSARPCCSSLYDAPPDAHPFAARSARGGLVALYEAWRGDPLMTLIRAVGFTPLLRDLRERFPHHPLAREHPSHPCDLCVALWREPALREALPLTAREPRMADRIAGAARTIFNEESTA